MTDASELTNNQWSDLIDVITLVYENNSQYKLAYNLAFDMHGGKSYRDVIIYLAAMWVEDPKFLAALHVGVDPKVIRYIKQYINNQDHWR